MPAKKSYRRFKKTKKPRNKKIFKSLNTVVVGRGFPKKLIMTQRYCERTTLTVTAGVLAVHNMACNSIYDPNVTGAGHQPLYHDQLTTIYGRYIVLSSKAKVTFFPSTSTSVPAQAVMFLNDDTSVTDSLVSYVNEQGSSRTKYLPAYTTDARTMTCTFSAAKTFGKGYLNNPAYYAAAGSNPTSINNFTLCVQPYDASSNYTLNAIWDIEYTVMWVDMNDVASS